MAVTSPLRDRNRSSREIVPVFAEAHTVNRVLDLSILDAGEHIVAVGRRDGDTAIGELASDEQLLAALEQFRDWLDQAVRGAVDPPTVAEIGTYGGKLFAFGLSDELEELYDLLPAEYGCINILSNHSRIRRLPWEYLGFPRRAPGHPIRERSVVRIVPTRGRPTPGTWKLGQEVRVLFVSAAPRDQNEVDFEAVKGAIQRSFQAQMPGRFSIEVVDGATRTVYRRAVAEKRFDILHFSGHGRVDEQGKGCLIVVDRNTGRTDAITADELSAMLGGRDIRLVVLSACDTATGRFDDEFSVTAEALVRSGIPAVVANQLPVSNRAMASFVGPLYTELLRSGDIDRAVLEGRIALDIDLHSFEWGIPTLYRQYGANQLYEP